ncbi:hypothetical protein TrVE_jg3492 [Triparma verrucosa]|uniref:RCK N-terminal domain-containing protein n=1 Tax=Triparma verrucosa TaxID=1606542 RepID=A0A9W7ER70_9STRA|nr:hypothetical protein TrVE_jg3492 [Triparma verrucosa]
MTRLNKNLRNPPEPTFPPTSKLQTVLSSTLTTTFTRLQNNPTSSTISSALSDLQDFLSGPKIDTLILLFATAVVPPLCKSSGFSPILGFLFTGMLMGPNAFRIIQEIGSTEALAELGIVFFLFEMGIELSTERLRSMRKDVFGLGGAQFFGTAIFFAGFFRKWMGLQANAVVVIGGGLALSSSAFVLQLLKEKKDLGTRYGKASFGILLFQDLAVVPLLVVIPILAGGGSGLAKALSTACVKAGLALGAIAIIGRTFLNRMFNAVAGAKNQEAFLGLTLLTVLSMSFLTEGLGLSNTLGAFLAGVLLSETKYRYQIEADIAPFRGVLLGLFFITVGFEIDIGLLMSQFPTIAGIVAAIVLMKALITTLLSMVMGLSAGNALQTGFLLSQGGEFAFVAFGMAKSFGILDPATTKLFLTSVALSMATTPTLASFSTMIAGKLEENSGFKHYLGQDKEAQEIQVSGDFVAVVGFGTVGKVVCDLLDRRFQRFIGIESDPKKAIQARNKGLPVFYGDVTRTEVCEAFNIGNAKAVILTINDVRETNRAVITLRRQYPDMQIFARAKDEDHKKRLQGTLAVSAMVPILPEDNLLLTLPFGGAVLTSLGTPVDEVNAILEAKRKDVQGGIVEVEGEEVGEGEEEEDKEEEKEEEKGVKEEDGKGVEEKGEEGVKGLGGESGGGGDDAEGATLAEERSSYEHEVENGGTLGLTKKADDEGTYTNVPTSS